MSICICFGSLLKGTFAVFWECSGTFPNYQNFSAQFPTEWAFIYLFFKSIMLCVYVYSCRTWWKEFVENPLYGCKFLEKALGYQQLPNDMIYKRQRIYFWFNEAQTKKWARDWWEETLLDVLYCLILAGRIFSVPLWACRGFRRFRWDGRLLQTSHFYTPVGDVTNNVDGYATSTIPEGQALRKKHLILTVTYKNKLWLDVNGDKMNLLYMAESISKWRLTQEILLHQGEVHDASTNSVEKKAYFFFICVFMPLSSHVEG